MSEPIVIQCPTCSKKFKLPAKPPAVFTCTQCQTPMDLSAFRDAAAAAKPTKQAVTGGLEGSRSSRLAGRGARARLRRSRDGGDDEGGEGGGGLPPKKDNSQAMVIGSLIGLVVVGGLALVLMKGKKSEPPPPVAKTAPATDGGLPMDTGTSAATPAPSGAAPTAGAPAGTPAGGAPAAAPSGTAPSGTAPAGAPAGTPAAPPPAKGSIHEVGHHPDATDDEQRQIDQLIQKAIFESGGADSRDAGKALVALGYKAAPRLINVFHTVKTGEGFDELQGRVKASVADGLLRKIDGFQERLRRNKTQIKATSDAKFAEATAKGWMLWWDTGTWKDKPQKPWDERIDGAEEEARKAGESDDK